MIESLGRFTAGKVNLPAAAQVCNCSSPLAGDFVAICVGFFARLRRTCDYKGPGFIGASTSGRQTLVCAMRLGSPLATVRVHDSMEGRAERNGCCPHRHITAIDHKIDHPVEELAMDEARFVTWPVAPCRRKGVMHHIRQACN